MKLAVFDFDSTLMDGETLEFFAKEIGIREQIANITSQAMNGEIDFFESLIKRVSLLKGIPLAKINEISNNLPAMNGVKEVINGLKGCGYKTVCFSGGFKNATVPFIQKYGIDCEFSNILHSKDGVLTGFVGGEMMTNSSKGDMLRKLQKLFDISQKNTIVIGDGANDLSMFQFAETRVAFCAKPILKKQANVIIEEKDLSQILNYI